MPDYNSDLAALIPWERPMVLQKTIIYEGVGVGPDYAPLANLGASEYTLVYWDNKVEAKDVNNLRAKKFVQLIEEGGMSPDKAAEELSTKVETLKKSRGAVEASVREAIETYGGMPPEVRRAWVRAKQNELLIKASDSDDPDMMELALKVSKAISDDIEVGISNKKPTVAIVNQPALPPALAALVSATELPEGIVLEGETEDIPSGD